MFFSPPPTPPSLLLNLLLLFLLLFLLLLLRLLLVLLPLLLLLFLCRYNSDSLGLLNNILPFKAVLYLFCPLHKRHFLQIIPDIIFPSRLEPSTWSSVNGFNLCILFTVQDSGILFTCPNQRNPWALLTHSIVQRHS